MRDSLVREVADRLDVPTDYVITQLRAPRREPVPAARSVGEAAIATERAFLQSCLASGALGRDCLDRLTDGHFSSELTRGARRHLAERFDDPLAALPEDDPDLSALITRVVLAAQEQPAATESMLRLSFLQLELRRIEREVKRAAQAGDFAQQDQLAAERQEILQEIGQTA